MEVVLRMPFFSFSNANIEFAELKKLTWRSYNTTEALPTTDRIEIINKKGFAKTVLDKNFETFVMHIAALEILTAILIYPFKIF